MALPYFVVITKCEGQAPDGTQVCADRDVCYRYTKPPVPTQDYGDFWKAGENCPNSISIPKGGSHD